MYLALFRLYTVLAKIPKSCTLENQNLKLSACLQNTKNSKLNCQIPLDKLKPNQKSYYYLQIQHFEADFLWKVSLKILNSGIIPKTFTHVLGFICFDALHPSQQFFNDAWTLSSWVLNQYLAADKCL